MLSDLPGSSVLTSTRDGLGVLLHKRILPQSCSNGEGVEAPLTSPVTRLRRHARLRDEEGRLGVPNPVSCCLPGRSSLRDNEEVLWREGRKVRVKFAVDEFRWLKFRLGTRDVGSARERETRNGLSRAIDRRRCTYRGGYVSRLEASRPRRVCKGPGPRPEPWVSPESISDKVLT